MLYALVCLLAIGGSRFAVADDSPTPNLESAAGVQTASESLAGSPSPDRLMARMQATYIWQRKPGFSAPYSGRNSLSTDGETGYTLSATLFLGARPWRNTEVFVNPEAIQSQNISGLHGLGGPSNGEAQKSGGATPTLYLARLFIRQTFPIGGPETPVAEAPDQFETAVSSRRIVLTVGNVSILDVFDPNPLTHDSRTQFMNWALLTHGAFDYAANARGYTWGAAVEYYHDDWAARLGRFIAPKESNGLALDFNVFAHYGDNLEVEHTHRLAGRTGKVRVLGFRNYEHMGRFTDAVAFFDSGSGSLSQCRAPAAPDGKDTSALVPSVCNVRRDQAKYGFGVGIDQSVLRDVDLFLRGSWNDGRTETYSFTEIERSFAVGAVVRGALWRRPGDVLGAAWVANGLSSEHRDYLRRGGVGFFIGDGVLDYRAEQMTEVYYNAAFRGLWFGLDYQHVENPGYNADRGRVNFFGVRTHIDL